VWFCTGSEGGVHSAHIKLFCCELQRRLPLVACDRYPTKASGQDVHGIALHIHLLCAVQYLSDQKKRVLLHVLFPRITHITNPIDEHTAAARCI